jgi:hypothetical protein
VRRSRERHGSPNTIAIPVVLSTDTFLAIMEVQYASIRKGLGGLRVDWVDICEEL